MDNSRRKFITQAALTGAGIPFLSSGLSALSRNTYPLHDLFENGPEKKLNILILGGTSFLGPHQIKYALERGHSISIFTRGKNETDY